MGWRMAFSLFFVLICFGIFSCGILEKDLDVPDLPESTEAVIRDTVFTFTMRHSPILDPDDPNSDRNWIGKKSTHMPTPSKQLTVISFDMPSQCLGIHRVTN